MDLINEFLFLQIYCFGAVLPQEECEILVSAELREIKQFGHTDSVFYFELRVAGALHKFWFETTQVNYYNTLIIDRVPSFALIS